MGCTVEFTPVSASAIEKRFEKALFAAKEQIHNDCNYYVRVDQGTLRDTSNTAVNGMELTVNYNQPYAARVYFTGNPSHAVNPNASLQWCHKAQAARGKVWEQILQRGINDG